MSKYKGLFTFDEENHRYVAVGAADGIIDCMDYEPKEPKRYRLVKNLPTFKAGEIFEIFDGNLYKINESDSDDTEYEVMAYHASTLKRFPNILKEWFEPTKDQDTIDMLRMLRSENAYLKGKIAVYEKFLKAKGFIKEEECSGKN